MGIGLLIAFLVLSNDEDKPTLASSAILDILAFVLNLVVVAIIVSKNYLEQKQQKSTIYQFVREKDTGTDAEPRNPVDDDRIGSSWHGRPSHGQEGELNPGYENDDDYVFQPGLEERSGSSPNSTIERININYQPALSGNHSGSPGTTNQNYVPLTGISTNTGTGSLNDSHHTGSTVPYEEPSVKNGSYISEDTAKQMGQDEMAKRLSQPYITFEKSNDRPNPILAQTASLPTDAAQVEPTFISDDSDSEVEDAYRPNEASAYADVFVQDTTPNTTQQGSNIRRHNTMEVNKNQLTNNTYVGNDENEEPTPNQYVFAKDPAPSQNKNRESVGSESIVANAAYQIN